MLRSYYELLEIATTAPAEEVKRAFRRQIARYHPDKVQHLGEEFQRIAAERAMAITEAYRILSDPEQRAAYDLSCEHPDSQPEAGAGSSADGGPDASPAPPTGGVTVDPPADGRSARFAAEHRRTQQFVRDAALARLRQALASIEGGYVESAGRGFDLVYLPKASLFGHVSHPAVFGRFVPCVDEAAIARAWQGACEWSGAAHRERCVFLLGPTVAPKRELGEAIQRQRARSGGRARVTLIGVDARDWTAHVPIGAPPLVQRVLHRLRA